MNETEIHAIILTLNEERHIGRCIESIRPHCDSITVVDSGSTDRTVEIARLSGANVLVNPWINYATQLNFGVDHLAGRAGWLLRIDADEILERDSAETISHAVSRMPADVDGIEIQRQIFFLGKRMRHGAMEPSWQLRLWRNGAGRCEQRWMDEHIKVAGKVERSNVVVIDINLNSLTWWTSKHNTYASREAIDILNQRFGFLPLDSLHSAGASAQARIKRFLKTNVYLRMPAGVRSIGYYLYRYVVCCGFLDGKSGFYWHLMQGLWYRVLVDAKVEEILRFAGSNNCSLIEAIQAKTGIDPAPNAMLSIPDSTNERDGLTTKG
jgi:glycosyltransferase involved in cell wall biosynthesis